MNRIRVALLALLCCLLLAVPAFAQDAQTFGLSDEDFQLFTAANALSTTQTSMTYDLTVLLSVTGVPDGDIVIDLAGTGALGGTDSPLFQMDLEGTASVPGVGEAPVSLNVRVVDNVIYFRTTSADGADSGWQGSTLEDALSQASAASGMPVDPMAAASDPTAALQGLGLSEDQMNNAMMSLMTLDPAQYISISRGDDVEGLAVFLVEARLGDLIGSQEISGLVGGLMGGMGGSTTETTPEQAAMAGQMITSMFADMQLTIGQTISAADSLVRGTAFDFTMSLDPAMMGAPSESGAPIAITLSMSIGLDNFGAPVEVVAPEGATMMSSGT